MVAKDEEKGTPNSKMVRMGDGEEKNDVTDEIKNEEQLLGLKGDEDNNTTINNSKITN